MNNKQTQNLLKRYINTFKLSTIYLETHADTEPRKWENYCMGLSLLGLFLYPVFSYVLGYFEYNDFLYIRGLFWFLFGVGGLPYGIRGTKSIITLLYKKGIPIQDGGLSAFFLTGAAIAWKMRKPVLAGCLSCFGGVFGLDNIYHYRYGISPGREFFLAYDNYQTKEQAIDHILNPSKYKDSIDAPYIQDIKKDSLIKSKQIEELTKRNKELESQINKIIEDSVRKK